MKNREIPNLNQTVYLSEIICLRPNRTVVRQEFAGGNKKEIAEYLGGRGFTFDEVGDLLQGFVIDSHKDSRRQFRLDLEKMVGEFKRSSSGARNNLSQEGHRMAKGEAEMKTGWGAAIRKYREGAEKTQAQVIEALGFTSNLISPVERETRKFTSSERERFFKFIGVAEDKSIPVMSQEEEIRSRKASETRAEAREKGKRKARRKPEEKKAASRKKVAKPKKRRDAPSADAPKAPAKLKVKKEPRSRGEAVPEHGRVESSPLSPVKQAVVDSVTQTLRNPGMTDTQAKRLHDLISHLTVTVLLEGMQG